MIVSMRSPASAVAAVVWTFGVGLYQAGAVAAYVPVPRMRASLESHSKLSEGVHYRPGTGVDLGVAGASIGGFTNVKLETTNETVEFAVDNLNLFFILEPASRFHFVAELQLRDVFAADEERSGFQDLTIEARRLFADVAVSNEIHIRAGTFLTPVGYWNTVLAPPLTWTTEAPLVIEEGLFQSTSSGLMIHGSLEVLNNRLGYSLFSQFLEPLADDPELAPADVSGGARLEYGDPLNWTIGASYEIAQFPGRRSQLVGLHALWQLAHGEVLCEILYEEGVEPDPVQWGGYVQGVLELTRSLYAVGRYEHFDPASEDPAVNLFTLGGVYKPFSYMAFKVEYRIVDTVTSHAAEGLFTSFTSFF